MRNQWFLVCLVFLLFGGIHQMAQGQSKCDGGNKNGGHGCPPMPGSTGPKTPPKCNICIPVLHAFDPNDIAGPEGYGAARYVRADAALQYIIRFENDPDFATAPAQRVQIRIPIDPNLKSYSFRVGEFGFGNFRYETPASMSYYQTRITNTVDSLHVFVDVTAGIDVVKNEAFWIFESIDPQTGLRPVDALTGFLPVNDTSITRFNDTIPKPGEGFVTFIIFPRDGAMTGDTCHAHADIVFDINPAIPTNLWANVVDAAPPHSQMQPLSPLVPSNSVKLEWLSQDDPGGSGVHNVDLYVSKNNGPFYLQKADIDTSFYYFQGEPGAKYSFYTRATDNVGNEEPLKDAGETSVNLGVQSFILINTPVEGYQYCVSDTAFIDWQWYNAGDVFDLFVSLDGGAHFDQAYTLFDTLSRPLAWVIPPSFGINGTNNCLFMIRSVIDTTLFGLSKPFSVRKSPVFDLGSDTTLIQGNTIHLFAGSIAGATYQWNSGETSDSITVSQSGLYAVTVTDANGCQYADSIQVNVVVSTNTPSFARILKLYPNPAATHLQLQADLNVETTLKMDILELNGRLVKHLANAQATKGKFTTAIDLNGMKSGVYLLRIMTTDGRMATLLFEKLQ